jgi:hypothetical protein
LPTTKDPVKVNGLVKGRGPVPVILQLDEDMANALDIEQPVIELPLAVLGI